MKKQKELTINVCPSTLTEGFSTYSLSALKNLFGGKKVSHILPYEAPQSEVVTELFIENRKRISISGVQEKLSLLLEKNQLRLTHKNEQGTYILKPIPRDLKKVNEVPANEHLTMQIARQIYDINTAENGMIFFGDGTPAYITKRFDVKAKDEKWGIEDFATLAGKTKDNASVNFKYEYSYEEVGLLIQKFVPAWRVEIEKYFSLVVFNYLLSNGDAHLKNFSLLESSKGDYLLSPAYDLINTRIHVDDTTFALDKGLFAEEQAKTTYYKREGLPNAKDFLEFAKRIGITETRFQKLLQPFIEKQPFLETLISRSFLSETSKKGYLQMYQARRNALVG